MASVQKPSELAIKASHKARVKKSTRKAPQAKVSVCDVMKKNTSSVIKKMQFQVPTYLQQYTDLYTAYLHSFDQLFGTCYIAEKEFFDKLDIDQHTLKSFDELSQTFSDVIASHFDTTTEALSTFVKMRIDGIETFDRYAQLMMGIYSNVLSQFNSTLLNK